MVKGSTLETSWMLKMCIQWKGENWYGNSRIGLRYNTGWLRQHCMEVVGTEVLSGGKSSISQITLPSGMPLNTSMKMACRGMVLLSHSTDVLCFLQLSGINPASTVLDNQWIESIQIHSKPFIVLAAFTQRRSWFNCCKEYSSQSTSLVALRLYSLTLELTSWNAQYNPCPAKHHVGSIIVRPIALS